MLTIVTGDNNQDYQDLLEEMYRMRYNVTHDQWGWRVPGIQPGCDRDEFDRDDTVYLIVRRDENIVGCARLNPTVQPHVLSEVFPECCDLQGLIRRPEIFEFSRYITDRKACSPEAYWHTLGLIEYAINSLCLRAGAEAVTWLSYKRVYSHAVSVWPTEPLGLPRYFADDDADYVAAISGMEQEGLARILARCPLSDDDLCFVENQVVVAAPFMANLIACHSEKSAA